MSDWDLGLISAGLVLISPIDEIAAAALTGGASAPAAPLQGAVSAILGGVLILKGTKIIK